MDLKQNKGKNCILAVRLGEILTKLNNGERLQVARLAEQFDVTQRTIIRDLRERFAFLDWKEFGPQYYSLNKGALGQLYQEDIKRFAHFASIQSLFPKIDQKFYQQQLTESVLVRGLKYEDITDKNHEFCLLKTAIEAQNEIVFSYLKNDGFTSQEYQIQPYLLINRNGIWYLIGKDNTKVKTFCFTQVNKIGILSLKFQRDESLLDEIKQSESIYYGNQIEQVLLEVHASVALYFQRRELLPNQTLHQTLENGNLQILSERVSEQEILSLVRYWIPHLTIIKPEGLQVKLEESLQHYLFDKKD